MLFLALKNVEMADSLLIRFPTANKTNSAKFSIPPTGVGGPSPSLNAIWKTLYAVSEVNVMKKYEKGHAKNKCDEKTPLEFLEFLLFYFVYGSSRQNKASPLETPQNCVTSYTPWKF